MAASLAVAMAAGHRREDGAFAVIDAGERLRLLTDAVRQWSHCENIPQFLDHIARAAVNLTGARRAVVILTNVLDQFQAAAFIQPGAAAPEAEPTRFNGQLVEQVVLSGMPVFLREIRQSQPFGQPGVVLEHAPTTVCCLPLDAGKRQIGVLYVEHPEPPGEFTDIDFQVLQLLALQGAIAIENIHNLTRATTDPLTRVFTHRHFMMLVDHELRQSRRENIPNALLLLDLDHFKRVNDTLGHQAGNEFIVEYAEFLKTNARSSDVVGRFGGDEFEILLPNTNRAGAEVFANKIMTNLARHRWPNRRKVTNSIGIALFTDHAEQAEMLFRKADEALYQAKSQGRNCYVLAQNKSAEGEAIDWSLDGRPRDPAVLKRLRKTGRRRTPSGGLEHPVLPFPGLTVLQLFEPTTALTEAQIAAAANLAPADLVPVLRLLERAGKLAKEGRGATAVYRLR